ncbi:MAG: GAF domain-containing protein [Planctomycetota bacterium]
MNKLSMNYNSSGTSEMPLHYQPAAENAFLSDVLTYDVDESGTVTDPEESRWLPLVQSAVSTGEPVISEDQSSPALAIPVYRDHRVRSVVILVSSVDPEAIGVFEVWVPVGQYEEAGLKSGYYSSLERFQNVSTFVRFERGSGLPGQVWQSLCGTVHDDLGNHPGFLRAAGASADALSAAIGIPVAGDDYVASVILINAVKTPMAQGFEVWRCQPDGYQLQSSASGVLTPTNALEPGFELTSGGGVPGLVEQHGGAMIITDQDAIGAGRPQATDEVEAVLAIPFYEADTLTSVTVLLL